MNNGNDNGDVLVLDSLETAQALRISRRHLWAMVKKGKIPRPLKLGSRSVWPRAQLLEWLESQWASNMGGQ